MWLCFIFKLVISIRIESFYISLSLWNVERLGKHLQYHTTAHIWCLVWQTHVTFTCWCQAVTCPSIPLTHSQRFSTCRLIFGRVSKTGPQRWSPVSRFNTPARECHICETCNTRAVGFTCHTEIHTLALTYRHTDTFTRPLNAL